MDRPSAVCEAVEAAHFQVGVTAHIDRLQPHNRRTAMCVSRVDQIGPQGQVIEPISAFEIDPGIMPLCRQQ